MLQLRKRWHGFALHARARVVAGATRERIGALAILGLAGACLVLASCREALRGLGPSPSAIQSAADQLFGAMTIRYTQPVRDAKYEQARNQLNRNALVPSNVFDDSTIWTATPSPVLRALFVQASLEGTHYTFTSRSTVARPARLGDSRHIVTLARLSPNEFVWDTDVEFGLGSLPAPVIANFTATLLGSAEHGTEQELRADYRAAAPRAAAVLGTLLSLDSIHTSPYSDGSTAVNLIVGIHADSLERRFPAFADYVSRYTNPARYRVALTDRSGAIWFDVQGAERVMSIRYRSNHGHLVPLYGAPHARPDTMELHVDFLTHIKLFTVGFRNLVMQFVVTETPHERAWTMVGRREPEWHLPLVTEHLIRSPLKRPFAGEGVIFHIGVRDSAGAQTLLERKSHLTVQESAILRFLNSLGSRAISDLADRTEHEEEQFLHEVFSALEADVHQLAPSLGSAPLAAPDSERPEKTSAATP